MDIWATIVLGSAVGAVAKLLMPSPVVIMITVPIGIVGASIGGYTAEVVGLSEAGGLFMLFGAAIALLIYRFAFLKTNT